MPRWPTRPGCGSPTRCWRGTRPRPSWPAMLAMPSNLLAHHLHALEQAGIITRRRSEGDRRRTYLQLIPGALDSLAPPSARAALRVLFVCTANSARSHLAAALWRRASTVPAVSAGTHPAAAIDPGAIAAATRHGLPLPRLRPRHISEVRHDGDLVITVCDLAHEELGRGRGGALVHSRPGAGWRPRQLRRGTDRAGRSRRASRAAPGGDRLNSGLSRRLAAGRFPRRGHATGLRRSMSMTSRQRPWCWPRRSRIPATRNPAARCRPRLAVFSGRPGPLMIRSGPGGILSRRRGGMLPGRAPR